MTEVPLRSPDPDSGTWAIKSGVDSECAYVIRFRSDLLSRAGDPSLPNLLEIQWAFLVEAPFMNGMPTAEQGSEMEAFENQLVAALEPSRHAILFAARTRAGSRHWFWYCGSRDLMEQAINAALAGDPSFPITMTISADPEWEVYLDLLEPD
jgi:hypothetical protein